MKNRIFDLLTLFARSSIARPKLDPFSAIIELLITTKNILLNRNKKFVISLWWWTYFRKCLLSLVTSATTFGFQPPPPPPKTGKNNEKFWREIEKKTNECNPPPQKNSWLRLWAWFRLRSLVPIHSSKFPSLSLDGESVTFSRPRISGLRPERQNFTDNNDLGLIN